LNIGNIFSLVYDRPEGPLVPIPLSFLLMCLLACQSPTVTPVVDVKSIGHASGRYRMVVCVVINLYLLRGVFPTTFEPQRVIELLEVSQQKIQKSKENWQRRNTQRLLVFLIRSRRLHHGEFSVPTTRVHRIVPQIFFQQQNVGASTLGHWMPAGPGLDSPDLSREA
jgi:hypothetical protein